MLQKNHSVEYSKTLQCFVGLEVYLFIVYLVSYLDTYTTYRREYQGHVFILFYFNHTK